MPYNLMSSQTSVSDPDPGSAAFIETETPEWGKRETAVSKIYRLENSELLVARDPKHKLPDGSCLGAHCIHQVTWQMQSRSIAAFHEIPRGNHIIPAL